MQRCQIYQIVIEFCRYTGNEFCISINIVKAELQNTELPHRHRRSHKRQKSIINDTTIFDRKLENPTMIAVMGVKTHME